MIQQSLGKHLKMLSNQLNNKPLNQNKMKKVLVNKRIGVTTSIIPHRNGTYPVWFKGSSRVEFIKAKNVTFIK